MWKVARVDTTMANYCITWPFVRSWRAASIAITHDSDKAYCMRESNSCCNEMHVRQCSPMFAVEWYSGSKPNCDSPLLQYRDFAQVTSFLWLIYSYTALRVAEMWYVEEYGNVSVFLRGANKTDVAHRNAQYIAMTLCLKYYGELSLLIIVIIRLFLHLTYNF